MKCIFSFLIFFKYESVFFLNLIVLNAAVDQYYSKIQI